MSQRHRKPVRRKQADSLPFTAREREIFSFCDHGPQCRCKPGKPACRRIDPMRVLEVLEEVGEALEVDVKLLRAPIPEDKAAGVISPAVKRLETAIRKAFGKVDAQGNVTPIPVYDERYGLTKNECLSLMFDFWAYIGECKKKADALRTSLGLELPPAFPSKLSATKTSSDSNSTSAEPVPDSPQPSQSGSRSPSEAIQENHSGETLPIP